MLCPANAGEVLGLTLAGDHGDGVGAQELVSLSPQATLVNVRQLDPVGDLVAAARNNRLAGHRKVSRGLAGFAQFARRWRDPVLERGKRQETSRQRRWRSSLDQSLIFRASELERSRRGHDALAVARDGNVNVFGALPSIA